MTQFTFATIPLWDGLAFYVDGNSKITWDNGTYAEPKPNAFSLPHIATCPGSTDRCRTSCYVHGLKKSAPDVYRHYELNELALHNVLLTGKLAQHERVHRHRGGHLAMNLHEVVNELTDHAAFIAAGIIAFAMCFTGCGGAAYPPASPSMVDGGPVCRGDRDCPSGQSCEYKYAWSQQAVCVVGVGGVRWGLGWSD